MSNVLLGVILGLYVGIGQVMNLSGINMLNALWAGVIAGICVGDANMGFQVGGTCLLMSLGFYTYGGATIPDYNTAAVFGTVIAARTGDYNSGITIAVCLALLMTQMDILGRATTTVFQHLGDGALAKNDIPAFERWTLCGTLPWILSRAIPVFLGMLLIDNVQVLVDFANSITWIQNGLAIVGAALPAVGFALLLSYMDLKRFWPFMIVGYVLYAYMGVPTIGLALVGAACGALFMGQFTAGGQQ